MTNALTPAEHRTAAENALDTMRGYGAGTPMYHGLVLTAIAHTLSALAGYLEPPPPVPGLPEGYALGIRQDENDGDDGKRRWAYHLTGPDGLDQLTRHRWEFPETALGAGVRTARQHAALTEPAGGRMNGQDTARETES